MTNIWNWQNQQLFIFVTYLDHLDSANRNTIVHFFNISLEVTIVLTFKVVFMSNSNWWTNN